MGRDLVLWARAVWAHWLTLMSGVVSLAFSVWLDWTQTPAIPSTWFRWIAAACFVLAFFWAWRDEHHKRLALEASIAPRLSIEYKLGVPPFYEKQDIFGDITHTFRIAVVNESLSEVRDVRVVLANCLPPVAEGIHLHHRMQVMGTQFGTTSTTIAPKGRAVFDVVYDVIGLDGGIRSVVGYGVDVSRVIDRKVAWRFDLLAEGQGPSARIAMHIRENTSGRIEMIRTAD